MRKCCIVLFLVCVLGLSVSACSEEFEGLSPNPVQIHYPVGLAVHPTGKFLYVANSNFDLAYTGGTVMVFDTTEVEPPEGKKISIRGVPTDWKTLNILKNSTVEVGSFGAEMVMNAAGNRLFLGLRQDRKLGSQKDCAQDSDCPDTEECKFKRCFNKTTKDFSSLLTLQVDASKSDASHLSCGQKSIPENSRGGVGAEGQKDVDGVPAAPRCSDNSKVFFDENPFPYGMALVAQCLPKNTCKKDDECQQAGQRCDFGRCVDGCKADTDCQKDQTCTKGRCVGKTTCVAAKDCQKGEVCDAGVCRIPALAGSSFCSRNSDCAAWEECIDKRLLLTHLNTGGLSELSIPSGSDKDGKITRIFRGSSTLPGGSTAVSILPFGTPLGGSGDVFLTSRSNNSIYILPSELTSDGDLGTVKVPFDHANYTRTTDADFRGVAVGYDKKNGWVRLYVASRNPDAILVFQLKREDTGKISTQLIGSVPVGTDPASIVYLSRPKPQSDLLYVVCSKDRRVDVIDTQSLQVIHQIQVGQQPYFISIYEPPSKDTKYVQHRRAYVTNFLDTSVSIIDLDTHKVVGLLTGVNTTPPVTQ